MPNLTEKENALLKSLGDPKITVLGKARMKEVAALIHRLMFLADEATQDGHIANTRYSFVIGAVHGLISKEDILGKGLPEPLETEALLLRQQHDDAKAYQAMSITVDPQGEYEPLFDQRKA